MLFSPSPKGPRLQLRISERRLLIMAGDTLSVVIAVLIALFVWASRADETFNVDFILPQSYWFFVLTILWLLLAGANDFYELSVAKNRGQSLQRLMLITGQLLFVYLLVFFFSPRDALPRLFIIYYGVASFLLIALWRLLNPALLGWAASARRVLIVGADEPVRIIIEALQQEGEGAYEIGGIISAPEDVGQLVAGVPVIGTGTDILNYVMRDHITELIITSIPEMDGDIFRGLMDAYEQGVSLVPMPLAYARLTGRVPVEYVNNNWASVLPITGHTIFNPYPFLQRTMDLFLGGVGLILFLVTFPFIALIVKLDSPGSIFYTQIRTGINGKSFRIIKYRTMVKDAEKGKAIFSRPGDPRVTRSGQIMRKTRLDELPQVLNVLRGDMSIVGPRPERPEHISRLTEKIPFYRTRLVVRPGLTGWAQVRYNYGSDDHDALVKLEYDLYYIRNQTILLDLNIIIRTVYKVIRLGGV
jgi:exopolysaccharide biosynthesis polyprenyl glycosylphosphotransferase